MIKNISGFLVEGKLVAHKTQEFPTGPNHMVPDLTWTTLKAKSFTFKCSPKATTLTFQSWLFLISKIFGKELLNRVKVSKKKKKKYIYIYIYIYIYRYIYRYIYIKKNQFLCNRIPRSTKGLSQFHLSAKFQAALKMVSGRKN